MGDSCQPVAAGAGGGGLFSCFARERLEKEESRPSADACPWVRPHPTPVRSRGMTERGVEKTGGQMVF